jgi:hypothetical protein
LIDQRERRAFAYIAARNLLIDTLTAEICGRFEEANIECMLVKGPVIGESLYRDAVRMYGDSDLLIRPADWNRAVEILTLQGFREGVGHLAHPRMDADASVAYVRGLDCVDLHRTLTGLDAPAEAVWNELSAGADRQEVGGRWVAVPGAPARLMHLALHAAHHGGEGKVAEDLRRGVRGEVDAWREAAALAQRLRGLEAFGAGLRLVPEGAVLAQSLGLGAVSSLRFELRATGVPTAEALNELLSPGLAAAQRWSVLRNELLPRPSFMRWWTPLASRGRAGLLASYPLRWGWLLLKVGPGLRERERVKRRRRRLS